MALGKGNLTRANKLVLALILVLPLLITLGKCPFMPTSDFLFKIVSLGEVGDWARNMQHRLLYVLTVPMGAILVVLCRLTLGIRILGPFRSILLALSFRITGIWMGLGFLIGVVATIVGIRPTLKAIKLPYFARVSVILSLVALIIIGTILVGNAFDNKDIRHAILNVAFFPIFVLCLVGDAFSRILKKEGPRSAFWRGGMTILIGIALTLLFRIPSLQQFLFSYPETLITQIGLIVVIAEYFDFRWFHWMNPGVDEDSDGAAHEREPHPTEKIKKVDLAA